MTYYVPEGTWYSLMTGEKIAGGRWRTEKHGFLSLPLLVKGGTVLPMGACETGTDYDYGTGVEFRAYGLREGEPVTVEIPTPKGTIDAVYIFTRRDGEIQVETASGKPCSVVRLD